MGNRAVITFKDSPDAVGIYLHWNGGRDSVEGFLNAAKNLGFLDRGGDEQYLMARLCQLIGNFFGGMTSLGVDVLKNLDTSGDNGVYIVDPNTLDIVGRRNFRGTEQHEYTLKDMTESVLEANQSIKWKGKI